MKYYLQLDGSTSTFDLEGFANIETGLPDRNIKSIATLGEGSKINGYGQNSGRVISADYRFKHDAEWERTSILDMFQTPVSSTLWLYKDIQKRFKCSITSGSTYILFSGTTNDLSELSTGKPITGVGISSSTIIESVSSTGLTISIAASVSISNHELQAQTYLGRMRVYATPEQGESYSNISISDKVGFKLYSESAYFESTSLTSVTYQSTAYEERSTSINILGRKATPSYTLTLSTASPSVSIFQVKTAEGYGFRVDRTISAGDVVKVNTSGAKLELLVNGVIQNGYFNINSTPFILEKGSNNIYITSGISTSILVSCYEKRL